MMVPTVSRLLVAVQLFAHLAHSAPTVAAAPGHVLEESRRLLSSASPLKKAFYIHSSNNGRDDDNDDDTYSYRHENNFPFATSAERAVSSLSRQQKRDEEITAMADTTTGDAPEKPPWMLDVPDWMVTEDRYQREKQQQFPPPQPSQLKPEKQVHWGEEATINTLPDDVLKKHQNPNKKQPHLPQQSQSRQRPKQHPQQQQQQQPPSRPNQAKPKDDREKEYLAKSAALTEKHQEQIAALVAHHKQQSKEQRKVQQAQVDKLVGPDYVSGRNKDLGISTKKKIITLAIIQHKEQRTLKRQQNQETKALMVKQEFEWQNLKAKYPAVADKKDGKKGTDEGKEKKQHWWHKLGEEIGGTRDRNGGGKKKEKDFA